MSWADHHAMSERLAADAEAASLRGKLAQARHLYEEAAREEILAFQRLEPTKERTRGIMAVSATSLFYKARDLVGAEGLAHRLLTEEGLPELAIDALRGLLQSIWSEEVRQRAEVSFAPGEVVVSVKGGEVVEGGAPLDLILQKVQTVQSLFFRTAELLRGLPHRRRGLPSRDIQQSVRPWLFQTAPGSYQFAVAIEEPAQTKLFGPEEPSAATLVNEFLRIVRATVDAPDEQLPEIVPDIEYQSTILKLTRSLAPTGRSFSQLDLRGATGGTVTLLPETREAVGRIIRSRPLAPDQGEPEQIGGVLRALHLDKDWIELTTVDGEAVRINRVGEAVDDVIGPMVNHRVTVQVSRIGTRRNFIDIEMDE